MPRLTSNERTGLLLVAIVAAAATAGMLLLNRHNKAIPLPPHEIETIYVQSPDSAATYRPKRKPRHKKQAKPASIPPERSPLDETI